MGESPQRNGPEAHSDQANTPRSNGKAERFIKILLGEWAYAMPFHTSAEGNSWLPRYLVLYNGHRWHMNLSALSLKWFLQRLLNAD
jgi:hypothetical protein